MSKPTTTEPMSLKKQLVLPTVSAVSYVVCVFINGISNVLTPLGVGGVSDAYPSQFTPAGGAFSIWGLIYTLLAIFHVYTFTPTGRASAVVRRAQPWLITNYYLNASWILFWVYQHMTIALVLMLLILTTLIAIYLRVDIRYGAVGQQSKSRADYWFAQLPFSVYLGWISVATVANVSITVLANNPYFQETGISPWRADGVGASLTAVMITVATTLSLLMAQRSNDGFFAGVVCWAQAWIAVGQSEPVVITAALCNCGINAVIILLCWTRVGARFLQRRYKTLGGEKLRLMLGEELHAPLSDVDALQPLGA